MSEITPEKTHRLLEKLVEHVMNNVPNKDEVPSKVEFKYLTGKVCSIGDKVDSIEVKTDALEKKVDTLLDDIDKQTQQLDIMRTE